MASGIFIVPILTLVANVDVHLAIGAYFVSTVIVLLVALPPMRVATMAVWFLINDDRDFALIVRCSPLSPPRPCLGLVRRDPNLAVGARRRASR